MADVTITAANVKKAAGVKPLTRTSGEVVGIGDVICINRDDASKIYKADADALTTNAFRNTARGIALSDVAATGQPVNYAGQDGDTVDFGAGTLEQGMVYAASINAGKMCPFTDFTQSIVNKVLTSNVATLTTSAPHQYIVGDVVIVSGVDGTFNGTYTITVVGSSTTFSYAKVTGNVSTIIAVGNSYKTGIVITILGYSSDGRNLKLLVKPTGIAR